jgi:hypothetical protein
VIPVKGFVFAIHSAARKKVLATEDNEENKDFVLTAEKRAKPLDTNSTNSHQSTQQPADALWSS